MDAFAKDLVQLGWPPVLLYKICFLLATALNLSLVLLVPRYPWPTTLVVSTGLSVLIIMASVWLAWQIKTLKRRWDI